MIIKYFEYRYRLAKKPGWFNHSQWVAFDRMRIIQAELREKKLSRLHYVHY